MAHLRVLEERKEHGEGGKRKKKKNSSSVDVSGWSSEFGGYSRVESQELVRAPMPVMRKSLRTSHQTRMTLAITDSSSEEKDGEVRSEEAAYLMIRKRPSENDDRYERIFGSIFADSLSDHPLMKKQKVANDNNNKSHSSLPLLLQGPTSLAMEMNSDSEDMEVEEKYEFRNLSPSPPRLSSPSLSEAEAIDDLLAISEYSNFLPNDKAEPVHRMSNIIPMNSNNNNYSTYSNGYGSYSRNNSVSVSQPSDVTVEIKPPTQQFPKNANSFLVNFLLKK
jgi:hypothetical protein